MVQQQVFSYQDAETILNTRLCSPKIKCFPFTFKLVATDASLHATADVSTQRFALLTFRHHQAPWQNKASVSPRRRGGPPQCGNVT